MDNALVIELSFILAPFEIVVLFVINDEFIDIDLIPVKFLDESTTNGLDGEAVPGVILVTYCPLLSVDDNIILLLIFSILHDILLIPDRFKLLSKTNPLDATAEPGVTSNLFKSDADANNKVLLKANPVVDEL